MLGYERLPPHAAARRLTRDACRARARRSRDRAAPALAALGYQETINFSFVEERWEHDFAGNADPIRVLNPIASQHVGDALDACSAACVAGAALQPGAQGDARARVRGRPRVPARRARDDGDARRRRRAPADAHRRPRLRPAPTPLQWGVAERAVDFFDVKGDVEALFAPRARELRRRRASGAASGPLRARSSSTAARSASSASCIRAGASRTSCRARRCSSSSTLDAAAWRDAAGLRAAAAPAVGRGATSRVDRRPTMSRTTR